MQQRSDFEKHARQEWNWSEESFARHRVTGEYTSEPALTAWKSWQAASSQTARAATLTLNGWQLLEVLRLLNPALDFNHDDMQYQATLSMRALVDEDGFKLQDGPVAWVTDDPEGSAIPLADEPAESIYGAIPDFEDRQVQAVYSMLSDMEPHLQGKPSAEHWEGWMASKIVASLRLIKPSSQSDKLFVPEGFTERWFVCKHPCWPQPLEVQTLNEALGVLERTPHEEAFLVRKLEGGRVEVHAEEIKELVGKLLKPEAGHDAS